MTKEEKKNRLNAIGTAVDGVEALIRLLRNNLEKENPTDIREQAAIEWLKLAEKTDVRMLRESLEAANHCFEKAKTEEE